MSFAFLGSQAALCRLKNGVGTTQPCSELCLHSREDGDLQRVVSSAVIHIMLKLYFKIPLSLYFPLWEMENSGALLMFQQISRDFPHNCRREAAGRKQR